MQEDPASGHGAYLCDMEVFRQLYNLESRILERSGQAVYVAVITIATPTHMLPDSRTLNEAMILLRQVTVDSLRRGDVISQYSQSQLVLLLTTLTLEDCELALSPHSPQLQPAVSGDSSVLLLSTVEPVDPAPYARPLTCTSPPKVRGGAPPCWPAVLEALPRTPASCACTVPGVSALNHSAHYDDMMRRIPSMR